MLIEWACKLSKVQIYSCFLHNEIITESTHWAASEFADLDHGDARLEKRARTLMDRFSVNPTASIPKACNG